MFYDNRKYFQIGGNKSQDRSADLSDCYSGYAVSNQKVQDCLVNSQEVGGVVPKLDMFKSVYDLDSTKKDNLSNKPSTDSLNNIFDSNPKTNNQKIDNSKKKKHIKKIKKKSNPSKKKKKKEKKKIKSTKKKK